GTGGTGITPATYGLAWGQYNSANTGSYSINFQTFTPSGSTNSSVVQVLNVAGIAGASAAPAWFFRSAGTNSSGTVLYGAAYAKLNTLTGQNAIQFQAYSTNGTAVGPSFQIQPNLAAYALGATNTITQETPSADHTGAGLALHFSPNIGAGSGYSFAWNETVTDSNGTHDQV